MKLRGQGSNCFSADELARYYDEYQMCFKCGMYNATDFHHNVERARPFTNSIINAIALCRDCHNDNSEFTHRPQQEEFFIKNMKWLLKRGYTLTTLDKEYIVEYDFDKILNRL